MRTEFQINIKGSRRSSSKKQLHKSIKKEPLLRQYLVLAEQVKQVLEKSPQRSMREISKWLGFTPARLSQIYKLTSLAPSIKEDILLSDNNLINAITITFACKIANEPNWETQLSLWKELFTHY